MSNCSEDTGVDELGYAARTPWQPCVSAKWREQQLKHAFSITLGKMLQNGPTASGDVEVPYLKAQHVQWDEIRVFDLPRMWASSAEIDALQLRKGDLLVCEGGDVGRSTILRSLPQDPTIIQNALHVVRGRNGADPRFLAYVLRHAAYQGWFEVVCNRSTIRHFTVEKFGEMRAWLPDATEQRAIADYLDRATARLDALVAAKERLLDLLAEKRRALITRAVTRGLAPNVPLRDSGIPWLGEIPAHWEVTLLRFACCSIETGGTPSIDYVDDPDENSVDWFTPSDFGSDLVLRESVRRLAQEAVSSGEAKLFPAGSVFVVGIGATLGKVGIIEAPASANQQINAMIPRGNVEPHFLAHVLWMLGDTMAAMANSATLPILNQQRMGEIRVPIPPVSEQRAIVSAVVSETKRIESVWVAVEHIISLLKERRSALIAAAVTGQIDVRSRP